MTHDLGAAGSTSRGPAEANPGGASRGPAVAGSGGGGGVPSVAAPTGGPEGQGAPAARAGFWLPAALRAQLLTSDTRWEQARFARGRECGTECDADAVGAVTARWPSFTGAQLTELLAGLRAARERAPRGPEYWARLTAALAVVTHRLSDPADPYHHALVHTLPGYTGYSPGMIAATLGTADPWNLDKMVPALRYQPTRDCSAHWQKMPGLPGRVRFFPRTVIGEMAGWVPVSSEMPLYSADARPGFILGYGAGDIPGVVLTMIILALSTTLRGEAPLPGPEPPPAVLVHNSRREPLATPLILAAIEEVDPDLVGMVASTVWDLDDAALRERLLGEADLVLATGDDDFIKCISPQLAPVTRRRRFQAHRNGASFSVIGREMLELQSGDDALEWRLPGGAEVIDVVALLAGLDASFWDQNAGLSARVHFVEQGGPADDLPAEYARRLTARLRQIAMVMPRGAWPVRQLHDPFDRYKTIEGSDRWGPGLRVMSNYDDPFVVVLDGRAADDSRMDPGLFASMVDECRTRVVLVRPVADIMEVVWRYLDRLPRHWLQSISIAAGRPGEGLTGQFLAFATACARRGVTTIRIIGSGAFPQPAYSWDGWLPLDLVGTRPPGYFTTIEFDSPFDDMLQTYSRHLSRLAKLPTAGPAARAPSRSAPRPR